MMLLLRCLNLNIVGVVIFSHTFIYDELCVIVLFDIVTDINEPKTLTFILTKS